MPSTTLRDALGRLDPGTRDLLAQTIAREGGDSPRDMEAVLEVILNRSLMSGQSIPDVINTKNAFTSMDPGSPEGATNPKSLEEAYGVLANPDPNFAWIPDMTYFYNPTLQAKLHAQDPKLYPERPSFAVGAPAMRIGQQEFYRGKYTGGPVMPQSSVLAQATGPTSSLDVSAFMPTPQQQKAAAQDVEAEHALLPAELEGIEKKADLQQQLAEQLQGNLDKMNSIYDRIDKANTALMDSLPDEAKMRQAELAKVSDQPQDPTRVLGQFLPMLFALGGAFVGGDAIGAMNATAAAMQAAKGNDQAALERAHNQWQDQMTTALEKGSIIHEELSNGLAQAKGNAEAQIQIAELLGAKYGIPALERAALEGDRTAIMGVNDGMLKVLTSLSTLTSKALTDQKNAMALKDAQAQVEAAKDPTVTGYWSTLGRFGHVPGGPALPSNLGWSTGPMKTALERDMAQEAMTRWKTDDPKVAAIADIGEAVGRHAEALTVAKIGPFMANVDQFEGTAKRAGQLVEELAPKGLAGSGIPVLNRWIQAGRKAIQGDPDVSSFDVAVTTFKNEYARIMSGGGTGTGAATTDTARAEAEGLINSANTPAQLKKNLETMQRDMDNRIASLKQTYGEALDAINSTAAVKAAPDTTTPPPAGATGGGLFPEGGAAPPDEGLPEGWSIQ